MVQHTSCLQCCPLWLPVCEWLWLYMPPDVQQRAGMSGLAPGVVLGRTGPGASPIVSGWKIPSTAPTTAHVPLPRKPLLLWLGSLRLLWSTCCASTPAQCHGRRLQKASPTLKSPHPPPPPRPYLCFPCAFLSNAPLFKTRSAAGPCCKLLVQASEHANAQPGHDALPSTPQLGSDADKQT